MRITLLCRSAGRPVNGLLDYSRQLSDALEVTDGIASSAVIDLRRRARPWLRKHGEERPVAVRSALRELAASDWVIFQYSPFGLGRWGFAPWTIPFLAAIRARARVSLCVHEPYVRDRRGRQRVMEWWQRGQLACLGHISQLSLVSISPWVELVRADARRTPTAHVAVGSNVPDGRGDRARTREALGLGDEDVVVAIFGTGHSSNLDNHITAALDELTRREITFSFMQLGTGHALCGGTPQRVIRPGWLPAPEVAAHLAAADVFLAPFVDGVSTRRGTVAAAVQQALPIVTTYGSSSGPREGWSDRGLVLTAVGDVAGFVDAAAELARDPERRRQSGHSARAYFEAERDWPVIARRIVELLGTGRD